MAAVLAPLLSMVIVSDKLCQPMARSRKRRGGGQVLFVCKQKVDGGAITVNGAIQVVLLATDPHIGFIHPRAIIDWSLAPMEGCSQHQ